MHNMSGWRKQLSVISGKRGRSKKAASSIILLYTSSYTGHDWKTGTEQVMHFLFYPIVDFKLLILNYLFDTETLPSFNTLYD